MSFKIPGLDQFGLPDLGVKIDTGQSGLQAPEFEDLSGQVPDICQALKAIDFDHLTKQQRVIPCPVCGAVGCASPEAAQARALYGEP